MLTTTRRVVALGNTANNCISSRHTAPAVCNCVSFPQLMCLVECLDGNVSRFLAVVGMLEARELGGMGLAGTSSHAGA